MPLVIEIQNFFHELFIVIMEVDFLWLPAVLVFVFWRLWMYYINSKYIMSLDWVLLEIKLPREITKTPKAMEVVFNGLHVTKGLNFFEKNWLGLTGSPWFSFEIVGIDGEIHFFARTQKFHRNLVESQLYAQYPDIEIVEVDDYSKFSLTKEFNNDWGSFGMEFALTEKDAYPIKTYVDYGLDESMIKEEQKTDPITAFLEILGSLKIGEQIWFQILIRATKKKWKKEGEDLIEEVMGIKPKATAEEKAKALGGLHAGKNETIKAIQRDISKLGFDVGIRSFYMAKKDKFSAINIPSIIGTMKQYNAVNLNGFKPTNTTSVDYNWQFKKIRENKMRISMLDAYRKRSYFYLPYERKSFVLNTEELATIFHFPGRVSETPTFGRIEAKKGGAPSNLPI